jgi:hypothetical protein
MLHRLHKRLTALQHYALHLHDSEKIKGEAFAGSISEMKPPTANALPLRFHKNEYKLGQFVWLLF